MRRDMDLIRDLLLKIEGGQVIFETISAEAAVIIGVTPEVSRTQEESDRLEHHITLLRDEGFIKVAAEGGDGSVMVDGLTWKAHDFLDATRPESVWTETKSRAAKVGAWTGGVLIEIAKAVVKGELSKHGVPLG